MFHKTIIKVKGMSCEHCENTVKSAVLAIDGIRKCKANAKKGEVVIDSDLSEDMIQKVRSAVVEAGYEVEI